MTNFNKKTRAVHFYLAQTDPELQVVREKFMNLRSFRTQAAKKVFDNPFIEAKERQYVVMRIIEWADIVLIPNWYLYATPELVYELKKAFLHQPYKAVGSGDITPAQYDIYYHEAKLAFLSKCGDNSNESSSKQLHDLIKNVSP